MGDEGTKKRSTLCGVWGRQVLNPALRVLTMHLASEAVLPPWPASAFCSPGPHYHVGMRGASVLGYLKPLMLTPQN